MPRSTSIGHPFSSRGCRALSRNVFFPHTCRYNSPGAKNQPYAKDQGSRPCKPCLTREHQHTILPSHRHLKVASAIRWITDAPQLSEKFSCAAWIEATYIVSFWSYWNISKYPLTPIKFKESYFLEVAVWHNHSRDSRLLYGATRTASILRGHFSFLRQGLNLSDVDPSGSFKGCNLSPFPD
jgi:hypothetical protein